MRKVELVGIKVAAGFVLAAALLAQGTVERPLLPPEGVRGGRCAERLVRALALTTAQQGALATLREETAEATQPLFEQFRTLREQIDTAAAVDGADPCAIGGLEVKAAALRGEIALTRSTAEANFVATLSAEQKATYDNFVAINPGCRAVGGGFGPPPRD